jgi:RNA polymerase sigma-70 factor (ECF subfamily)
MDETIRQNESALVCAAKSGDRDAIQRLLKQNWAWLKSLVYGIVRQVDDVDDVLQDICVKVISKISTIRDPESFRPWLACLARREAISYHRHRSRQTALLEGLDKDRIQPLGDDSTADSDGLEQAEQIGEILQAVRGLPDKYREVFLLQYGQDLAYRDMAEILDVPVTTIAIRLVRARKMILDAMAKQRKQRVSQ